MEKKIYDSKLVSVIIPTYNSEKYIENTVFTVMKQTYADIEIIIVDDCSKDNTQMVIERLARQDFRIRFVFQDENQGAAVARNMGIRTAKGRYIAFLDSDDLWEPQKIEKQLNAIKEGHPFVYCAYDFIDDTGNKSGNKSVIKREVSYKDELTKTYISTPTVIYDREFFDDPDMPLRRTGQDYAFWLVLLKKSKGYGIDEALVHVMRRQGSLSRNKLQSLRDVYEVQTRLEGIGKIRAVWNTSSYLFYAIRKKMFCRK